MSVFDRFVRAARLFGLLTAIQIVLSPLRKAYHTARFAQPRRRGPALWLAAWRELRGRPPAIRPLSTFTEPGAVTSFSADGQTVTVACANASIRITVLADDLMRVQLQRPGETDEVFSYAVARPDAEWPAVPFAVHDAGAALDIRTAGLVCRVQKSPCRLAFLDPRRGDAVIASDAAGLSWSGEAVACSFGLAPDEHIYGLGEKAFGLDRRGRSYEMWNDDPNGAYPPGRDPLYLNIPFFIGLRRQAAYGVFFDNTYRSRLSFQETARFEAVGGPLRYYFFADPAVATILDRYTELTGRMRLPPLWTLGYHQSRWSYTPDSAVRALAQEFRRRRIPCDAIHLDIHYMDGYRCFTWRPQRFPDPAGLLAALHDQGFKVVPLIDCGIKSDRSYGVCRDGLEQGVFCAFPDGSLFRGPVWPGDCYFPDFTSPRVRAWWGQQYKPLLDIGVDGIWNDMNEPTVFAAVPDTLPDCVVHDWDGRGASHAQAHNVYGMQMARATAEGLQALRPERRPFVLTRSAWAGVQRYAINWTGDNISAWEHLRLTMPMVANLGLCGLAFTGPDTGGFARDCTPELLARWTQLGAFTPFFRNHAALGTAQQEPWIHGEPYESINRRYIELRYHLLPYIYTAFWQCAQTGLPMLRPLFLQWQDDEQAQTLDDQFMFGDALLIAPVGEPGATVRSVYLPAGVWYDWWTGDKHDGGQQIPVAAPLDRLPIFARAGSVVPGWPVMQHTGEHPVDTLTLHIFPGHGDSVLYEDDGASMAYQRGEWRVTHFTAQEGNGTIEVKRHSEGSFAPPYAQVELVVHGMVHNVRSISADEQALAGWVHDAGARAVRCRSPLADSYRVNI